MSLKLTLSDITEIVSSALLAEMDYLKKLEFLTGDRLERNFLPTTESLPKLKPTLKKISEQFGLQNPQTLEGLTLENIARFILEKTYGTPQNLIFHTSGSTGNPVASPSKFTDLKQEIEALANIFDGRKRIVSFVPRHHIYGFLFSILLPKKLRVPVLFRQPLPSNELVQNLKYGDLVIAFPLLWSKLAKLNSPFCANIFAVTSTGPCPPEIIAALKENGLAQMTEVYGSSETGGVGYRHSTEEPYTLLSHWKKIDEKYLERESSDHAPAKIYPLQDALNWIGENTFTPLRRNDKAVQVGGINVYPSRVEKFFTALPQVSQCSVRLMRPEQGDRLKIFIVPSTSTSVNGLEKELRALASSLKTSERPGQYSFGSKLPTSALGKLCDW